MAEGIAKDQQSVRIAKQLQTWLIKPEVGVMICLGQGGLTLHVLRLVTSLAKRGYVFGSFVLSMCLFVCEQNYLSVCLSVSEQHVIIAAL